MVDTKVCPIRSFQLFSAIFVAARLGIELKCNFCRVYSEHTDFLSVKKLYEKCLSEYLKKSAVEVLFI